MTPVFPGVQTRERNPEQVYGIGVAWWDKQLQIPKGRGSGRHLSTDITGITTMYEAEQLKSVAHSPHQARRPPPIL
jgi:hypothetical protein